MGKRGEGGAWGYQVQVAEARGCLLFSPCRSPLPTGRRNVMTSKVESERGGQKQKQKKERGGSNKQCDVVIVCPALAAFRFPLCRLSIIHYKECEGAPPRTRHFLR